MRPAPKLPPLAVPIGILLGIVLAASAARAQDERAGKALAERWCTSCHAVSPNAGGDAGPTFAAIANRPVFEPNALRIFLTKPHPPMPELNLTRNEVNDLIAYLQTLRASK